jgi:hypothetical protein
MVDKCRHRPQSKECSDGACCAGLLASRHEASGALSRQLFRRLGLGRAVRAFFSRALAEGNAEVAYTPMQHKGDAQPIAESCSMAM